jgi:hypothetical protein
MAQHLKRTLINVYERPSQQVAIVEFTQYWSVHDPALAEKEQSLAVAPGTCNSKPKAISAKPELVPQPDCINPSGCVWCEQHRDIDSLDYVWSLACFRHLKIIELSRYCPPTKENGSSHPADDTTDRLNKKLTWFRTSNAVRQRWVEEALARIEEGDYHDQWSYLIDAVEGKGV